MRHLFTLAILFAWINSFSQTINYADSVISFSSQYSAFNWSANQTLGYPNAYPSYGDIITAWAHSTADGQREFIELNFNNPMPIDSIWIYETWYGGSVDTIYVLNPTTSNWEVVYSGAVAPVTSASIFKVGFPMTTFNVSTIRIAMDSPSVFGWNEIDAVAIVNSNPINTTICNGDSILIGSAYYSAPGVYADSTIADDDIEYITVQVGNATYSSTSITACDSYTSPSGSYTWTSSNTYLDTIANVAGCDSILTINLTINSADASTTTTSSGSISASATGASYQWLDCDNSFSLVPGETSQLFTPVVNGNYAVSVAQNGCIDTSACVSVMDVGVNEFNQMQIDVYPNPVQSELTVSANALIQKIIILDMTGREVYYQDNVGKSAEKIQFDTLPHGIYLVQVEVGTVISIRKIVH